MQKETKYKPTRIPLIGNIPENWKETKLKYIGYLYSGLTGKSGNDFKQTDNPQTKPFIPFTNIANNLKINRNQLEQVVMEEDEEQNKVEKNDLFFMMSSENFDDVGKATILSEELGECYLNSFCKGFRITDASVNPLYLTYLLISNSYRRRLMIEANGFTRINLKMEKVNDLEISLPPTGEQTTIANFLDEKNNQINNIISQKEKLIEQLKIERTEIINHAVTKGVSEKAEMKTSGTDLIKEIPKGWTTKRIKYIATTFGRIGYRGYQTSDLVNEGEGAITLSPSNMKDLEMDYNKCTYLSWNKYEESPEIQIKNGDVIFVKTGSTFGKTALVNNLPEKATINPQLLVFKNIKINNDFFYFVLLSELIRGQVNTSVIGGTIPTISQEKIGNYYLFVPPIEEQKEIVATVRKHLVRIKNAIATIKQEIELIKEYKAALINEVVTGKIILN